ncbi:hypothetical protein ACH5RR_031159 [Cinchona calisaya]|uniref:Uncharacterized protein n=1 Tax=Cinchona calisaya TaxID=153742 RepID=A0ABD2YHE2_9GENT
MGCGKSKHAVSTTDTISQSKRSNSKKTDDVKTSTNTPLQEQEKGGNVIDFPEKGNGKEGGDVNKGFEEDVLNGKESEKPKDDQNVKESEHQENGELSVIETVHEMENKEAEVVVVDDTKEAIQKEGLKEESVEEPKKEEGGGGPDSPQQHFSPKKEEALNETEGNQIKEEEEAVKTDETEELANTEEEKAPAAKEENATESSAKDTKTT